MNIFINSYVICLIGILEIEFEFEFKLFNFEIMIVFICIFFVVEILVIFRGC